MEIPAHMAIERRSGREALGMLFSRKLHRFPTADANMLAKLSRTPSSHFDWSFRLRLQRLLSPCDPLPRHLDALVTKIGEVCGLSFE